MIETVVLEPGAHIVDVIAVAKQLDAPCRAEDAEVDPFVANGGPLAGDANAVADERGETTVPFFLEGELAGEVGDVGV